MSLDNCFDRQTPKILGLSQERSQSNSLRRRDWNLEFWERYVLCYLLVLLVLLVVAEVSCLCGRYDTDSLAIRYGKLQIRRIEGF